MPEQTMRATRELDIEEILSRELPWEELSGQCVLVTGAGGFLGGYLTRTLLALYRLRKVDRPVRVVAMVRDIVAARARLRDVLSDQNFEVRERDLSVISTIEEYRYNYVIHAASQASPRFYGVDPVGTLLPNAVGTAALLQALKNSRLPKGMLFISSSEIYGSAPDCNSLGEEAYGFTHPTEIRACYAEAKRFGEALCAAWYHQHKIPTYIVRPFHTYGPGLQEDDGRVFADFVFNIARGENIVMTSDGSARRAFCYVSDAIAGFFTVLLTGRPAIPYNVANATGELSISDLARLLVRLYPDKKLSIEHRSNPAGSNYLPSTFGRLAPDTSRLEALGWRAEVDVETGFRRTIEAC